MAFWQILIDVDEGMPRLSNSTLRARLARAGYYTWCINRRTSPGGKGEHIRIRVYPTPPTAMEIVALQAVCGSDPLRESSNILRARNLPKVPKFWQRRWNVLYGKRGND